MVIQLRWNKLINWYTMMWGYYNGCIKFMIEVVKKIIINTTSLKVWYRNIYYYQPLLPIWNPMLPITSTVPSVSTSDTQSLQQLSINVLKIILSLRVRGNFPNPLGVLSLSCSYSSTLTILKVCYQYQDSSSH